MSLNELMSVGNGPVARLDTTVGTSVVMGACVPSCDLITFSSSSGGSYSASAAALPNGAFYYAGAGAATFNLPSVASLAAVLSSGGITGGNLAGLSVFFSIINANAGTSVVTVSAAGDSNWTIHTAAATVTFAGKYIFQAVFTSATAATLV
jgi:hypothetical protein